MRFWLSKVSKIAIVDREGFIIKGELSNEHMVLPFDNRLCWSVAWVIALIGTMVLIIAVAPVFETNDDSTIAAILSGSYTGRPSPYAVFINYALSKPLACLYAMVPSVAWWSWFQIAVLVFSSVVILFSLLLLCHKAKMSVIKAAACALVVWIALFPIALVEMQFTLTSGLAGLAALCLVFVFDAQNESGSVWPIAIFAIVLICLSLAIRWLMGCLFILACGLLFAIRWWQSSHDAQHSHALKALLVFCIASALGCACLFAVDQMAYSGNDWAAFSEFNAARAGYMDYPHLSYDDASDIYDSVGWTESLQKLSTNAFLLDPALSTSSFIEVTPKVRIPTSSNIKTFMKSGFALDFATIPFRSITLIGVPLLTVLALVKKKRITALIPLALLFCFDDYLLIGGRFVFRVVMPISYAALIMLLFIILEARGSIRDQGLDSMCGNKVFYGLLIGALVCSALPSAMYVCDFERINVRSYQAEYSDQVRQIASDNPNAIFVSDITIDSGTVYALDSSYERSTNLMFWGGWLMRSPLYCERMSSIGENEFSIYSLLNENVLIMHRGDNHEMLDALVERTQEVTSRSVTVQVVEEYQNGLRTYKMMAS